MKMERSNGGDPNNNFLLPFYDWDELTQEQKKEVGRSLGKWMGIEVINYRFGKGIYYGQHIWFAHAKTTRDEAHNARASATTQSVRQVSEKTTMTEKEFHSTRRMFFVKDGTVLIAPEQYPYTHFEWISSNFGVELAHEWIEKYVRGYFHNGRLVAYVGINFAPVSDSHRVNHKDLLAAIDVFEKLVEIKEIGLGAIQDTKQPWEPKVLYDLEEYKGHYKPLV